jgi:hypothetical protein
MDSTEDIEIKKHEAVDLAKKIISRETHYIIGCREMQSLMLAIYEDPYVEDFYNVFVAITSGTDHLPVGDQRQHWNREVLKEKDQEIERIYKLYKDDLMQSCEIIVSKFNVD